MSRLHFIIKNGKAPGRDGLRSEIVKFLGDIGITTIIKFFNTIYNTGIIQPTG